MISELLLINYHFSFALLYYLYDVVIKKNTENRIVRDAIYSREAPEAEIERMRRTTAALAGTWNLSSSTGLKKNIEIQD